MCHLCGLPVGARERHWDHVVPLSKGGAHSMDNIRVSHAVCNQRKGNRV
jgi:5-methylcytosine-specific restriction endonuclease McrA